MHPEANIIFGAVIDDTLGDEVRVTRIGSHLANYDLGNRVVVSDIAEPPKDGGKMLKPEEIGEQP